MIDNLTEQSAMFKAQNYNLKQAEVFTSRSCNVPDERNNPSTTTSNCTRHCTKFCD